MHSTSMKYFFLMLFLATTSPAAADERQQSIALFIAVDRSLSMESEFAAVQQYLAGYIVDRLLHPGDFLLVAAFYGQAQVIIAQEISGGRDKDAVKNSILGMHADGRFTDIGNAIDLVATQMELYQADPRKKYVMLVTDSLQEAPLPSRYYNEAGVLSHGLLEYSRTIEMGSWRIVNLGVATKQMASEYADQIWSVLSDRE